MLNKFRNLTLVLFLVMNMNCGTTSQEKNSSDVEITPENAIEEADRLIRELEAL